MNLQNMLSEISQIQRTKIVLLLLHKAPRRGRFREAEIRIKVTGGLWDAGCSGNKKIYCLMGAAFILVIMKQVSVQTAGVAL